MISAWPAGARHWQPAAAKAEFRARRLGEPLARYLDAFDAAQPQHAELVAGLADMLSQSDVGQALLLAAC